jgi:hypothetical protein
MEQTQSSETSAFNTQTPGKYPEDNISLLQHGESLKTKTEAYFRFIGVPNTRKPSINENYIKFSCFIKKALQKKVNIVQINNTYLF